MTRATRGRVLARLKRKGEKSPYDMGYAKGWEQGRTQLANALASPEGFVATDGSVFRLVKMTPLAPELEPPIEIPSAPMAPEDRGTGV